MSELSVKVVEELCHAALHDVEAVAEQVAANSDLSLEQRKTIALECARNDGCRTARLIESFALSEQTDLFQVAEACLTQHGFAAQHIRNFGIESEEMRAQLAMITESTHAAWGVPQFFKEFEIQNPEARVDLAKVWAEVQPFRCAWHFRNFEIESEEVRAEIGSRIASLDPRRALIHLDKFDLKAFPELEQKVVFSAFASDFESTRDYGGQERAGCLTDPRHFQGIISASLSAGNIENALVLQREQLALQKSRFITVHEAVEALDAQVASFDQIPRSDELEKQLRCYQHLRSLDVQPTNSILRAYTQFSEKDEKFLDTVVLAAGESFADHISEALLELYGDQGEISEQDKPFLQAFLSRSFRGFSAETFSQFRDIASESRSAGFAMINEWELLSKTMLQGQEVSYEETKHPLYAEVAFAAYRPKKIALSHYKTLLPHIEGCSEHLEDLQFQRDGYRLDLDRHVKMSLPDGVDPETKRVAELVERIAESINSPNAAPEEVVPKLLRGGLPEDDLCKLIGQVVLRSSDLIPVQPLQNDSLQEHHRFLVDLHEQVMTVAPVLLKDELLNESSEISKGSYDELVAKTLDFSGSIGAEERTAALAIRLDQQLRPIGRFLAGEMRKYQCEGGGSATPLNAYLSKAHHAFLARAGADLSSALDFASWENSEYLQISLTERLNGRFAGVVQLHRFETDDGQPAVLARLNATPHLARKVNPEAFAASTTELCQEIAERNGWELYFPEQGDFHALTNRLQHEEAFLSRCFPEPIEVSIDVTDTHTVEKAFRVRPSSPD